MMLRARQHCAEPAAHLSATPLNSTRAAALGAHAATSASRAQLRAWSRLFEEVGNRTVIALGDSLLGGMGCSERGQSETQCAYPARLGRALSCRMASNSSIRVINRAVGGTTTAGALPQLPLLAGVSGDPDQTGAAAPDVVLIDYSLNDQSQRQDWTTASAGAPGQPSADAPSPSKSSFWWAREWARRSSGAATAEVGAATESMLRYLLTALPNSALWLVESSCSSEASRDEHQRVAAHYGVPFFAYADVLRQGCDRTSWAGGDVHPTWHTHEYIAQALAVWWQSFGAHPRTRHAAARRSDASARSEHDAPRPLPAPLLPSLRDRFAICASMLSVYDARTALTAAQDALARHYTHEGASAPTPHGVRIVSGDWVLEDRGRGKAGWLSKGQAGSVLEFDVPFGRSPRLSLVYERSYERFGRARVALKGVHKIWDAVRNRSVRAAYVLDGILPPGSPRVTHTELLMMNVQQAHVQDTELGIKGFGVKPHSNHTLQITTLGGGQFKVRFVASC